MTTHGFREQLQKLFNKMHTLSGGVYSLQSSVVNELLEDEECVDRLNQAGYGIALLKLLVLVIWDEHLEAALQSGRVDPPRDSVLCGFGQVRDRALTGTGVQKFVATLGAHSDFCHLKVLAQANNSGVENEVKNINDVIASLIRFRDPNVTTENKTRVVSEDLFQTLRDSYDVLEANPADAYSSLGGVPAIMADALAQLGLANVAVITPYHANSMTQWYQGRLRRFHQDASGERTIDKALDVSYSFLGKAYDHPVRCSYIAAYDAGHVFSIHGQNYTAGRADRAIFRVPDYVGNRKSHWSDVCVQVPSEYGMTYQPKGAWVALREDEWPFFAFLHDWSVNKDCLSIHVPGRDTVESIGKRYDYMLLNAPRIGSVMAREQDACILLQQLKWLDGVGTRLHLEVSGVDAPETIDIVRLRDALGGTVRSMGINDKELFSLSQAKHFGEVTIPPIQPYLLPNESEITKRYQAALHLCYELNLDRLYVHANDLDLVLRKNAQPSDLRKELHADLLAKWTVVLASIQRRNATDWQRLLAKAYGAGSSASHPLEPSLLANGFKCLIELFTDLAIMHPSLRDSQQPSVEELLLRGYWLNRAPGEYSVVGVPVMWPNLDRIEVNTTGAGDLCSGISAVYSGF